MLIHGKLLEGGTGAGFDNVNPATEEVIGTVADASIDDVKRAIAAARRAFDESSWSRDPKLRQRCILQLQAAIEADREEFRKELIAEAGCPMASTTAPSSM